MAYLLGIDQGTTQTTAVVVDERGSVVACRTARLAASLPRPGWYALDGGIFAAGSVVQWLAEGLGLLPGPAASMRESRERAGPGCFG